MTARQKTCVNCGGPFWGRADGMYCSGKCNQQAHRRRRKAAAAAGDYRQATAEELAEEGRRMDAAREERSSA